MLDLSPSSCQWCIQPSQETQLCSLCSSYTAQGGAYQTCRPVMSTMCHLACCCATCRLQHDKTCQLFVTATALFPNWLCSALAWLSCCHSIIFMHSSKLCSSGLACSLLMFDCSCRLILLDAFALLYRSHFGWKDVRLNAKTGEDTGILFAFVRTVFDLLELEPPPTHFAVVFDAAGHTFR